MSSITVSKSRGLKGQIQLPGDKSISHRAVIIGSISEGITEIDNFLKSQDCLDTIEVFKHLGVNIYWPNGSKLIVEGTGLHGLRSKNLPLYFGNSGTGARLSAGVLAGQPFISILTGDTSLSKRPMGRIVLPLRQMGAEITGEDNAKHLPLRIKGGHLNPIFYKMPVASAQVKSSILLAGLYAKAKTCINEPYRSRDHTERMLSYFGATVSVENLTVCISPTLKPKGRKVNIPNDISAAVFFIVAASIVKNSKIQLMSVGINPTRVKILDILKKMNADIKINNQTMISNEPRADIFVKFSKLKSIEINEDTVPLLIDELPILMVAATQAEGKTLIKNASELRIKETDRIKSMVTGLRALGADITNIGNDIVIKGPTALRGADVSSFADHRTAMSLCIAGLIAERNTKVENTECIKTSFPEFEKELKKINS